MKTTCVLLALLLVTAIGFSQSNRYQSSMQSNIALLDSAKSSEDYTSVSASFERIADAEKTQWLPYYYAALANIWKGFTDTKADKDAVADKADALIAKAEAIEPKNSEIMLLKSMSSTLHMLVDPMTRWQKYGTAVAAAMATAKQLDPNNPRVYYWEAQNLMGTPEQFGGGKAKAKPVFEKSIELFKTFKPINNLYPNWGQQVAERMLKQTQS
jgi:hypothetical protein